MRDGILWFLLLIGFIFMAFFMGVQSFSIQAQEDAPAGEIVFASDRDGDMEIYRMDSNGENVQQLTANGAVDDYPSWSPDGRYIAFLSNRDGAFGLYVMTAEGENVRRIATYAIANGAPSWSPDGVQIAFGSDRDGDRDIYLVNADGSHFIVLTDNEFADYNPVWSPDGSQIAFTSDRDGEWDIFVIPIDGSAAVNVSQNPDHWEFAPAWSPGGQLSFQSFRDGDGEIYTVSLDNLNAPVNLTNNPEANEWVHSWLPSGEAILFQSNPDRTENWELFLMSVDGSEKQQLTTNTAYDGRPMWRPSSDIDLTNALDLETAERARIASALAVGRQPLTITALVVEETFAEGSDWRDVESENGSARLVDGQYEMKATIPNWSWWLYRPITGDDLAGMVIEADIDHTSSGYNNISLICRAGQTEGYFFDVHSIGLYSIRQFSDGEMTSIMPRKASPVINRDAASNHLMAVCVEDYLALYINGQLVAEAYDNSIEAGMMGIAISTSETSQEAVALFDNLRIWAVEPTGPAITQCWITVDGLVNIRIGPGTEFASVGQMMAGARLLANGQTTDDDDFIWWRFADHTWVRSDVVNWDEDCSRLPQVIR
jgi:hypothetical protein